MLERQCGRRQIRARIVVTRTVARGRADHDSAGTGIEIDRRGRARRRCRRRRQQLADAHRVAAGGLVVFLYRPHAHVVERIDDGERIVAPASAAAAARIGGRVVARGGEAELQRTRAWRPDHRAERIAGEARDVRRRGAHWRAGHAETDHGVALAGHGRAGNPVLQRRGERRRVVVDRAGLVQAWRGVEVREFIPARGLACGRRGTGDAGRAYAQIVRGPQAAVANHRRKQAVVERIETTVDTAGVAGVLDRIGRTGGRHRHVEVGRDRWRCASGIADPAEHDAAVDASIGTDEVARGRGWIEVVRAARGVRAGRGRADIRESRHQQRPGAERRSLLHDVAVGAGETARSGEHVAADVKRIDVDAERGIVAEAGAGVGLELEEGPSCCSRDRAIAGRVADRQ